MKKKKVVHRIPKDAYLVSKRNRVFENKKKLKESKLCKEKVNFEEDDLNE